MDNFRKITVYHGNRIKKLRYRGIDKGQKNEMATFIGSLAKGKPWPFSFDELFDTTCATLAIHESLITGSPVYLADFRQQ
jgi:hypothetical protein